MKFFRWHVSSADMSGKTDKYIGSPQKFLSTGHVCLHLASLIFTARTRKAYIEMLGCLGLMTLNQWCVVSLSFLIKAPKSFKYIAQTVKIKSVNVYGMGWDGYKIVTMFSDCAFPDEFIRWRTLILLVRNWQKMPK